MRANADAEMREGGARGIHKRVKFVLLKLAGRWMSAWRAVYDVINEKLSNELTFTVD